MEQDAKVVSEEKVACDGCLTSLGHPKVYLYVDKENGAACPYCGQVFIYSDVSRNNANR